jgi:hypothetical protein
VSCPRRAQRRRLNGNGVAAMPTVSGVAAGRHAVGGACGRSRAVRTQHGTTPPRTQCGAAALFPLLLLLLRFSPFFSFLCFLAMRKRKTPRGGCMEWRRPWGRSRAAFLCSGCARLGFGHPGARCQ